MKIVVITGSPHRHGTSALLADEFIRGAEEVGHSVTRFDAAFMKIGACLGCDKCMMSGPCCQKDDMEQIMNAILQTDMIVFATPLYYYGMSTQLKAVIDRFYSKNGQIQSKHMDSALLSTCWNSDIPSMRGLKLHYEILVDYLNFNDKGAIYGLGCGTVQMAKHTDYPQQAYKLGRSL